MMTARTPDALLDSLVADLAPVRRHRPIDGGIIAGGAVMLCVALVATLWDLRADVWALSPEPIVVLRSAALLLVGVATVVAALASARPGVGGRAQGWSWALLAAALIPAAALWGAAQGGAQMDHILSSSVPWCFGISLSGATLIGGVITTWLRQGAVTEPARAAWLTGLAAGAFGTFAYSLHCPSSNIYYAGLWYSLTVGISAFAARLILPRLLRW